MARVHGGVGTEDGGIYCPGASLAFYLVTARTSEGVGVDLREESGINLTIEKMINAIPSIIAYDIANSVTGELHIITEGHSSLRALALQDKLRELGNAVGINKCDISGTIVSPGQGFIVSVAAV